MKKLCLRIAVALVSFAGLGITAKAQAADQIVVTIPFEFVVAGKTLPAGTYRVNRVSDDRWAGLILSSFENRSRRESSRELRNSRRRALPQQDRDCRQRIHHSRITCGDSTGLGKITHRHPFRKFCRNRLDIYIQQTKATFWSPSFNVTERVWAKRRC